MSVSTKRMIFVAAMAFVVGMGAYHWSPGSMHERRLSGVVGLLSGYIVGRVVAPMVFADVNNAAGPANAAGEGVVA